MPTLSRQALEGEGFTVIERREPSLLVDGCVLITGEVDRTTEFERGMPPAHQWWTGQAWEHDPLVLDDQALVVNVRDRGLVVVTGCGHSGVVNIVRHAKRLTGVPGLHALIGGFHLERAGVRADHRAHRRRAGRPCSGTHRARALHRLACAARARGRPARCLGRGQQRLVLQAGRARRLTGPLGTGPLGACRSTRPAPTLPRVTLQGKLEPLVRGGEPE